jgi:hypothetical protein
LKLLWTAWTTTHFHRHCAKWSKLCRNKQGTSFLTAKNCLNPDTDRDPEWNPNANNDSWGKFGVVPCWSWIWIHVSLKQKILVRKTFCFCRFVEGSSGEDFLSFWKITVLHPRDFDTDPYLDP